MRIAVCDDEYADRKFIENTLSGTMEHLAIELFENGEGLLESAGKRPYFDLVFLDIYLKNENGIDLARMLKKVSPETEIIFTTFSKEHALEAFSVRAVNYLVKPLKESDVLETYEYIRKKGVARQTLYLRNRKDTIVMYLDELLRIEGSQHDTILIKSNGSEVVVRVKYGDVLEKLDESFVELRRGVTVNMDGIKHIRDTEVLMEDETVYAISRLKKNEVTETYSHYMMEKKRKQLWR